jgi:hypothetical protein
MAQYLTVEDFARLQATVTSLQTEVARLRRRHRRSRRLLPLALVAVLVALLPLSLFAAGFTDLPDPDEGHNADINAIAAAGITHGCNPPANDQYCPHDLVTRQEMASFLARLGGLGGNPPVANAQTAQNAAQLGGVPAASYVQGTSPLLPIAFAIVSANGTKLAGTANVSTARSDTGIYLITISGEAFVYDHYVTVATLVDANSNHGEISTSSGNNQLEILTRNSSGTLHDDAFQFVVFKP